MCEPCVCLGDQVVEGTDDLEVGLEKAGGKKATGSGGKEDVVGVLQDGPQEEVEEVAKKEGGHEEVAGQMQKAGDGSMWKLMWVQVEENGEVKHPIHVQGTLASKPQQSTYAPPTPKAVPPTPSAMLAPAAGTPQGSGSELQQLLTGLTGVLARVVNPAPPGKGQIELEEPGPKLRFTPEAKAWTLEQRAEDSHRMAWPLEPNLQVNLDKFKLFLETHCGLSQKSVAQNVRLVGYVYGMFQLPAQFSQEGFWASLYLTGKADVWVSLQVVSPSIPNTANISTALDHLISHLIIQADRKRHTEASRCLNGFKKEVLAPLHHKVQAAKADALQSRKERDAEKLNELPPWDVLKGAVHNTMVALHWASVKAQGLEEPDANLKGCANVLMAGLIFCNSYAGRPGEWSILERADVVALLEAGKDWLKMSKHKTKAKHGSAGRAVPAGNREAMKAMLEIHPESAKYLFDPRKSSTDSVTMSALLTKWSETFTPEYVKAGATLQRKLMHSMPQNEEIANKVFEEICKYDKHRTKTGRQNYLLINLEEEAKKGAIIFRNVLGTPVVWPTDDEMQAGKEKAMQTLDEMYTRSRANEDGENEEGGEEDEFDEEEKHEEAAEDHANKPSAEKQAEKDKADKDFDEVKNEEYQAEENEAVEGFEAALGQGAADAQDGDGKKVGDVAMEEERAEAGVKDEAAMGDKAEAAGVKEVDCVAMEEGTAVGEVKDEAMEKGAAEGGEAVESEGEKGGAAEGEGVWPKVEAWAGLSQEAKAWIMTQYAKQAARQGLTQMSSSTAFFKALKLLAKKAGVMAKHSGVSAGMLKKWVLAEESNPPPPAPPPPAPASAGPAQEGRKRKKISPDLDSWVVEQWKKAMEECDYQRCLAASSILSNSSNNSSSLNNCLSSSLSKSLGSSLHSSLSNSFSISFSSSHNNSSNNCKNNLSSLSSSLSSSSIRCSIECHNSSISSNPSSNSSISLSSSLSISHSRSHGLAFFKQLKEQAIHLKLMTEDTCTASIVSDIDTSSIGTSISSSSIISISITSNRCPSIISIGSITMFSSISIISSIGTSSSNNLVIGISSIRNFILYPHSTPRGYLHSRGAANLCEGLREAQPQNQAGQGTCWQHHYQQQHWQHMLLVVMMQMLPMLLSMSFIMLASMPMLLSMLGVSIMIQQHWQHTSGHNFRFVESCTAFFVFFCFKGALMKQCWCNADALVCCSVGNGGGSCGSDGLMK